MDYRQSPVCSDVPSGGSDDLLAFRPYPVANWIQWAYLLEDAAASSCRCSCLRLPAAAVFPADWLLPKPCHLGSEEHGLILPAVLSPFLP